MAETTRNSEVTTSMEQRVQVGVLAGLLIAGTSYITYRAGNTADISTDINAFKAHYTATNRCLDGTVYDQGAYFTASDSELIVYNDVSPLELRFVIGDNGSLMPSDETTKDYLASAPNGITCQ